MRGHVRPSVADDIDTLLNHGLRSADLVELEAVGITPRTALEEGMRLSVPALTAVVGDEAAAMFGVAKDPRDATGASGLVWLLGSDRILEVQRQFLRESREWLEVLEAPYEVVGNVVHHKNELHIKWLRWLGFSFGERTGPFIHFSK